jgi:hypothetical protein
LAAVAVGTVGAGGTAVVGMEVVGMEVRALLDARHSSVVRGSSVGHSFRAGISCSIAGLSARSSARA